MCSFLGEKLQILQNKGTIIGWFSDREQTLQMQSSPFDDFFPVKLLLQIQVHSE